MVRIAQSSDVTDMMRVRHAVRENRLTSTVISCADVEEAITSPGRGWVIERDGAVVAFAIGNAATGNVWALFVDPAYESRGFGRLLHDTMLDWLWSQGLTTVWLTTECGTRAQMFYETAGWLPVGAISCGEQRYERQRPAARAPSIAGDDSQTSA